MNKLSSDKFDKVLNNNFCFDIIDTDPVTLWEISEQDMDGEFLVTAALCLQAFSEHIQLIYERQKGSTDYKMLKVEKAIERFYRDGVFREDDIRRIIKAFAKLATMVQGSIGKETTLMKKLAQEWFRA